MSSTYPGTLDAFTNPSGTQFLSSPDHSLQHSDINDAVEAIETAIGTTSGTSIAKLLTVGKFALPSAGGTATTTSITSGTLSGVLIGTSTITGGTAGAVTLGTPIMDFFTSSGTSLPTKANRGFAPTVGTLSDSAAGTITPNAAIASVFEVTLGTTVGTRTIGTPANPTDGEAITLRVKQNAGVTGTLVFAPIFRFSTGTAGTPVLGTTLSAWNYYGFRYNQTDSKWDNLGGNQNIT